MNTNQAKESSINSLRWSTLGSILPKIINPIVSLLLVNIISSKDYGIFAIISFVISFINLVQGFGFTEFLIREKEPTEDLLNTVFWTNLFASIILYISLLLATSKISEIYKISDLNFLIPISGLIILINPIQIINSTILQKNLEYKKIFFLQFFPTIILFLITLPLALLKYGVWSLVASQVVSAFIGSLLYFKFSNWRPSFKYSKTYLHKIIQFGKWVTLEKIIEYLFSNFDLILVGYLCDIQKFGIYSIARSLSTVLFTTVNGPLGVILFPILSKVIKNENGISEFFLSISKRIYAVNLSIIICVLILSKDFLPFVFLDKKDLIWLLPLMVIGEGISRLIWIQRDMYKIVNNPRIYPISIIPNIILTTILYLSIKTNNILHFALIKVANDLIYFTLQNLLVKSKFKISLTYIFKYSKAIIIAGLISGLIYNITIYSILLFIKINILLIIFIGFCTAILYVFVFSKLDKAFYSILYNDLMSFIGKKNFNE